MSMFSSGYTFVGIFLAEKEQEQFVHALAAREHMDAEDVWAAIDDLDEIAELQFFELGDECEGIRFTPFIGGGTGFIQESWFLAPPLLCMAAERQPSLFTQAYTSPDELYGEFKEKLEGLVPDDFPWEEHVGTFQYSVFA